MQPTPSAPESWDLVARLSKQFPSPSNLVDFVANRSENLTLRHRLAQGHVKAFGQGGSPCAHLLNPAWRSVADRMNSISISHETVASLDRVTCALTAGTEHMAKPPRLTCPSHGKMFGYSLALVLQALRAFSMSTACAASTFVRWDPAVFTRHNTPGTGLQLLMAARRIVSALASSPALANLRVGLPAAASSPDARHRRLAPSIRFSASAMPHPPRARPQANRVARQIEVTTRRPVSHGLTDIITCMARAASRLGNPRTSLQDGPERARGYMPPTTWSLFRKNATTGRREPSGQNS